MTKKTIIKDDSIIEPNDYEKKAEYVIRELGRSVFINVNQDYSEDEQKKTKKFYKNEINPILTPMQVTNKLNRLLRVYRPMSNAEARNLDESEYRTAYLYYCDIISYINEYIVYLPDKQTFCSFVNITSEIYNDLLVDPYFGQTFMSFEDSFIQSNFNSAQAGIVDSKSTIAKLQTKNAGHSLVKSPESVTFIQNNKINYQSVNDFLDKFEAMTKKQKYIDKK